MHNTTVQAAGSKLTEIFRMRSGSFYPFQGPVWVAFFSAQCACHWLPNGRSYLFTFQNVSSNAVAQLLQAAVEHRSPGCVGKVIDFQPTAECCRQLPADAVSALLHAAIKHSTFEMTLSHLQTWCWPEHQCTSLTFLEPQAKVTYLEAIITSQAADRQQAPHGPSSNSIVLIINIFVIQQVNIKP